VSVSPRIIYSPRYNIGLLGLERLHPFDSRKYARAVKHLRRRFGRARLNRHLVKPPRPITQEQLLAVHTKDYLQRLRDPKFIAKILEVPPIRFLPRWLIDHAVLKPMRYATAGTILAAREAIDHGLAINLSGGYHHASPDEGHGFCVYADVALAVHDLRESRKLAPDDKIAYIDLDAHQGDGVCKSFVSDPRVLIYDQYNQHIFPRDPDARRRIDCDVPVPHNCSEADYLAALRTRLPAFLDAITRTATGHVRLAIYNAGSDVYIGDQLGGLTCSADGVLQRDQFVLDQCRIRKIPTVVLLSGGYSRQSYQLVANMVAYSLEAQ